MASLFPLDTLECASNPCGRGQCIEGANRFECLCFPGFTGDFCEIGQSGAKVDQGLWLSCRWLVASIVHVQKMIKVTWMGDPEKVVSFVYILEVNTQSPGK